MLIKANCEKSARRGAAVPAPGFFSNSKPAFPQQKEEKHASADTLRKHFPCSLLTGGLFPLLSSRFPFYFSRCILKPLLINQMDGYYYNTILFLEGRLKIFSSF